MEPLKQPRSAYDLALRQPNQTRSDFAAIGDDVELIMGRPRLLVEVWAKIAREVAANPNATQKELARKIGVSRSMVGRVMRAPRDAAR